MQQLWEMLSWRMKVENTEIRLLISLINFFPVDIVVHTAGAVDARMSSNLISALGKRHKASGRRTYYIHVSSTKLFEL